MPLDGQSVSELDRQVAAAKEHLLRQVDELRKVVDYDYPPVVVASNMRSVRSARRSYADAWKARAAEHRAQARAVGA